MRRSVLTALILLCCTACGDANPGADPAPGGNNANNGAATGLVINEVSSAGNGTDWFELYNSSDTTLDLDGYSFTDNLDSRNNVSGFRNAGMIEPGEHLLVEFDATWPGFGLRSDEELGLIGPDDRFADTVDWLEGESPEGGSFARIPDGTGPFQTTTSPTPGTKNTP